jgi:hypothetical protein
MALVYQNGETQLNAFVDSDYAGDTVGRKSTSGYFVKIGDAACIWGTKKRIACFGGGWTWHQRCHTVRSDNQSAIEWATAERIPLNRAKH